MIDTISKIYTYITASGTGLYTLIGTRAYSPVAPSGFDNSQATVIFHLVSESSHVTGATHMSEIVFKCYGGTVSFADARAVYRALWDRLHGKGDGSDSIIKAEMATGLQEIIDGDTGEPCVLATYRCLMNEAA